MSKVFEIKVAADTDSKQLASSITSAYSEERSIVLVAIGPQAVSCAIKAIIIANSHLVANGGAVLSPILSFTKRMLPDFNDKTKMVEWVAISMRLVNLIGDQYEPQAASRSTG